MTDRNLAETLCALRSATGETQDELAEATGLNKYSISKWERGDRAPQMDALFTLWTHFDNALGATIPFESFVIGDLDVINDVIAACEPAEDSAT